MRDINDRFVMVPTVLLEVPSFVRNFDSKPIGSIYRVLCSRIWRKPKEGLRKNASKRTEMLSSLYEAGSLASMHDLKTLSDAMGYTDRSVRRELSRLEELSLIKVIKVEREVFYVVGESSLKSSSDRFMGNSSEALYLDSWKDFVNFLNEYLPQKVDFFDQALDKFFTKDGQEFHKLVTKISQNATLDGFRKLVWDMETDNNKPSLIEKVKEKGIKPLAEGHNDEPKAGRIRDVDAFCGDVKMAIFEADPKKAVEIARKAIRNEVITHSERLEVLKKHVPAEYAHYSSTPGFAIELGNQKNSSNEDSYKLSLIWSALREDFSSSVPPKNSGSEFGKILGNFKAMLKKYSFNQIYWTLTTLVSTNGEGAQFSVRSVGAFEFFVRNMAKDYQKLRDLELRKIKSRDILISQNSDMETVVQDDPEAGHAYTGRLLDALMGWGNDNE
jgi:hypothetical protein